METPAQLITARELRNNLRNTLDSQTPLIIGNRSHPRAILIPVPLPLWPTPGQRRSALALAKRHFATAIRNFRPRGW